MNAKFTIYHDNYNMQWEGFNDSMGVFIESTMQKIKDLNMAEQRQFFNQSKERLLQDYKNFYLEQAYRLAFTTMEMVLLTPTFEKKELKKVLETFEFDEFVELSKQWFTTGRFVWLVHGNFEKQKSVEMIQKINQIISISPIAKEDLSDVRCVALDPKVKYVMEVPLDDPTNENNCLVSYFEFGPEGYDLRSKMIHEVVMQYLEEPTFNQLRTIEQLGYVVFARTSSYRDVMGAQFII